MTRVKWRKPKAASVSWLAVGQESSLDHVEDIYAEARRLERQKCDNCVDRYFDVALATAQLGYATQLGTRGHALHETALRKLVSCGQSFCRLDPRIGLRINGAGGALTVPVKHVGFVWRDEDFETLTPVGGYKTNAFRHRQRQAGVGIPLVVSRSKPSDRPYLAENPVFAATLVMDSTSARCDRSSVTLKVYDPLRVRSATVQGQAYPLAKDLSAPLAFRLKDVRRSFVSNFVSTSPANAPPRLFATEPYQRGKVPVVLIHGLFSNPFTWVEMVNQLRATHGFVEHFQIWGYEYPTGHPVLENGEELRRQLNELVAKLGGPQHDPMLSEVVLVGHSLGGLVAKLAVTHSGDRLWQSVASVPPSEVRMTNQTREQLNQQFFFQASPHVSRVVFIGTPHQGSVVARRLIGKIGSALVVQSDEATAAHDELIQANPGVFSTEVQRRNPTSIDTMEPGSCLLQAISGLPVASRVRMHSVIGDACRTLSFEKSDGVVPVESAQEHRALTERYVDGKHSELNKLDETIGEVQIVLEDHLRTLQWVSQ